MNRRQFLGTCAAGLSTVLAPSLVSAERRPPLILHTVRIRPKIDFMGEAFDLAQRSCAFPRNLPRVGDVVKLRPGDRLELRHLAASMGHHMMGLFIDGEELRHFESMAVGSMFELGEPMFAVVTADDKQSETLRIDIVLDRPLEPGERLPLLEPWSRTGLLAYLEWPDDDDPPRDTRGWQPVVAQPWTFCMMSNPYFHGYYHDVAVYRRARPVLVPIAKRRGLWNDTPWPDLDPAVTVVRIGGKNFAYVAQFRAAIEQLLLREERVEARFRKPGGLGEVYFDFSLVG